jgi:PASTA domain
MRTVLPRFGAIVIGCLLASATLTFAAGNGTRPAAPAQPAATTAQPAALVVPDVRNQAYVFAKGTLEDAGFAWKVTGSVEGYAANVVVTQSPSAGTRVVDTGAPLVTLGLARNPGYVQEGEPENVSPFAGTALELAGVPTQAPAPAVKAPQPKPTATPKPKPKPTKAKPAAKRPPAFAVAGAPAEPLDEMPLTERASRLARYVDAHRKPSDAAVRHWLYQHEWIVTGARFGWWRGAEALELLVAVDRKVERRWGIGTRSRRLAQRALAEVRARS